jgi:hypothetical protein
MESHAGGWTLLNHDTYLVGAIAARLRSPESDR